jgi:hypothetical protein
MIARLLLFVEAFVHERVDWVNPTILHRDQLFLTQPNVMQQTKVFQPVAAYSAATP